MRPSTDARHAPLTGGTRLAALCAAAALLVAPLTTATAAVADDTTAANDAFGNAAAAALDTRSPADIENALNAQVGDLLDVRIGDVHPTQPSLGFDEIYYKVGRYTLGKDKKNKRFDDWCEANGQDSVDKTPAGATLADPKSFTCKVKVSKESEDDIAKMKTVVIGPNGVPYLTDGHHTLTSFIEAGGEMGGGPDVRLRLRVVANLKDLSEADFWATMEEKGWTWLQRVDGQRISPAQLPQTLGLRNFEDDPNRSLLYFARDIGYTAGTIPFQEFYWGAWVRDTATLDLSQWDTRSRDSYLQAIKAVAEAQVALPKDSIVTAPYTAAALGALPAWNQGKPETDGEWAKLSMGYDTDKPGKIAYAMEYKATLADASTVPNATAAPGATRTDDKLTVEWIAPRNGGAPITGYTVALSNGASQQVAADARTVTFEGVTPGRYTATVVATNRVGSSAVSAPSNEVEFPTPAVDPTQVFGTLSVTGELRAGATITVAGAGFATNTAGFKLELHSDPVVLADATTDAAGAFSLSAKLPQDVTGNHRLVLLINGVEVGGKSVTIAASQSTGGTGGTGETGPNSGAGQPKPGTTAGNGKIAETGSGIELWVATAGFALLLAGGAVVLVRRARTATEG